MDVKLNLRGGRHAAAAARDAVGALSDLLPDDVIEDVRLLVSELVTNGVRHANAGERDRIHLRLRLDDQAIRVDVEDPGPGFVPRDPGGRLERTSGWGLVLVDRIADRWGVDRAGGSTVWFEIEHDGSGRGDLELEKIPA
jgi:anti-sigma regulatory factor (Ser/Thr protein kinase)